MKSLSSLCNIPSQANGGDFYRWDSVKPLELVDRCWVDRMCSSARKRSFLYNTDGVQSLRTPTCRWRTDLWPGQAAAAEPEMKAVCDENNLWRLVRALGPDMLNTWHCISEDRFLTWSNVKRLRFGGRKTCSHIIGGSCWQVWSSLMQVEFN